MEFVASVHSEHPHAYLINIYRKSELGTLPAVVLLQRRMKKTRKGRVYQETEEDSKIHFLLSRLSRCIVSVK